MNIKPIKTEADYEAALKEIENIFDAEPDTPKGDKLDVLATLVEAYERKHYPIPPLDVLNEISSTKTDRSSVDKLQERLNTTLTRLSAVTQRIQKTTADNEVLRQEIALLRCQLADTATK